MDAAPDDGIAADSTLDTEEPDTAEPPDTTMPDSGADSADDVIADTGPRFCEAADPNLIGCYRFENDKDPGQPHDDSMYGHHGTSTGVKFPAGRAGRAIDIDGMSYTNVPDRPTLGVTAQITIEAWIKARSLPTDVRAGIVDANGRYGFFILVDGSLRATAPLQLDSAPVVKTGAWQHVAYTYDGFIQKIYVDGAVVKEQMTSGGTFGTGDDAGLAIGMNSPNGNNFDGLIDSVRIFRVARSAAQICAAAGKC